MYGNITLYVMTFQPIPLDHESYVEVLQPRHCRNNTGLGCFHFARHYSGNRYLFLFLRILRCFSSLRWPSFRVLSLQPNRLSHSDILGSTLICSSPKLFAAYHVLHRLLMPRHSPCALISLNFPEETFAPSVHSNRD